MELATHTPFVPQGVPPVPPGGELRRPIGLSFGIKLIAKLFMDRLDRSF